MSVTYILNPQVSLAETDDGAVLLHERTGRYWQLNTTGFSVLRSLTSGQTSEEAAQTLASQRSISATRARDDIAVLLGSLCSADLLRERR
ncbi:lasso peptide biosynthesis PqqD family chaperone [Streptomyces sp. SID9727]|uniref:lasso peptide biosynthesis PqqD family chaperone n=1 Tax=Streptomyces sp. SID9727 TaxID=2706114 RepID=UPI0013C7DBA1|nr:lasso peptide biosynthesis PqqD family chaperone [Streptomyces sp. SID9727]NEC67143.1 lasso peptide biosynthesis PqqD family chaperone [Streptomyces sp. SID9727]